VSGFCTEGLAQAEVAVLSDYAPIPAALDFAGASALPSAVETGAEPVAYGEGLVERVRALARDGVDLALDVAGSGVLPELIELAGGAGHVITIADFGGAQE
jgi:hypothetical protein